MQFLKYTVIRLALFFVVFLPLVFLLRLARLHLGPDRARRLPLPSAYLFFNKLRLAANADVQKMFAANGPKKSKRQLSDEEAEDRFLDGDK